MQFLELTMAIILVHMTHVASTLDVVSGDPLPIDPVLMGTLILLQLLFWTLDLELRRRGARFRTAPGGVSSAEVAAIRGRGGRVSRSPCRVLRARTAA